MRTVAIIQARMSSSRLPGKVLMQLDHRTTLEWVVRAARLIPGLDAAVVATSDHPSDDPIVQWCADNGVTCHRGPLDDVLGRFLVAAASEQADVVIRLTADCPLLDPHVCGDVIALFRREHLAYASNVSPPSWPDGLSCEVMTREALDAAGAEAGRAYEREHVTPFIRDNRYRFPQMGLPSPLAGVGEERWTLDEERDLLFIREIVKRLPTTDRPPAWTEILAIIEAEPALREINLGLVRNAAIAKSMTVEAPPNRGTARAQAVLANDGKRLGLTRAETPVLSHGYKSRVWDVDGTPYVDLVCGYGTVILGHQDADIDAAMRTQIGNGIVLGATTALEAGLAEALTALVPHAEAIRFVNTGAETNRTAIAAAQAATKRSMVLACGYDGLTPGSAIPATDAEAVHAALVANAGNVAAIIAAPSEIRSALRELASRHQAVLIFDETLNGLPSAPSGIVPDLSTFGRALGNGLGIAAVAGRVAVMDYAPQTVGTCDALALAAAMALTAKLRREPVVERLSGLRTMLVEGILALIHSHGLGHKLALDGLTFRFPDDASRMRFHAAVRANGVFMDGPLCLSYAHSDGDIAVALRAFDLALAEL